MNIRQTSTEAYHAIRDQGLLSQRRFEVYETLVMYGPATAGEMVAAARARGIEALRHSLIPRLAELKTLGVIKEVGERPCKRSGHNCVVWDVTPNLPVYPDETKNKKGKSDKLTWDFDMPGAIRDMRKAVNIAKEHGFQPTDRLIALRDWLTNLSS